LKIPEPRNVRPYNQDQMQLFPPSVQSLIESDALCMVVNDVVKALDLSCLYEKHCSEGNPAYHPAMMLKIYFYSYSKGIFSSRRIAQALKENVAFIFLAAWQKPNFRTVSDFRKNNLKELGLLFAQIVGLCRQLGMVKLGHIAIDGTKIKANASEANTYDRKRIEKDIKRWLEKAEAIDRQEDELYGADKTGDELPEEIRDPQKRIKKLKELKKRLNADGGQKINKTDPDAVFMKTTDGIKTAYNAQVAVDAEHQVIVAADVDQLLPMVEQTEKNTSEKIKECSADSGYSSAENLKAMATRGIDAYIPDRHHQSYQRGKTPEDFDKENFVYDQRRDCYICVEGEELHFSHLQKRKDKEPLRIYRGRACQGCRFFGLCTTSKNGRSITRHPYEKELRQMRRKLDSETGKAIYGQRKYTAEPPIGHIKSIMGFTGFQLRGKPKVTAEFKLVSIAHNLRKIWFYLKSSGNDLAQMCSEAGY
jgi:transposase